MTEFWFLAFGIKEVMVASKVQKLAVVAAEFWILNFGSKEAMVASNIKKSAAAAAELWVVYFGIKEVMVVKNLVFADLPFPESATAKSKKSSWGLL